MNKVSGLQSDFHYFLDEEGSTRYVLGYGLKAIEGSDLYEWYEVYLPKKQTNMLSFQVVKDAIIKDIDDRTDARILNGYQFTPDGAEEAVTVWLSKESQTNFSEAHRLQMVPVKFKLNETEDKQAIYHTFTDFAELDRFYTGGVIYINQCLNAGWVEKDSIDWEPYQEFFPETSDEPIAEEP